MFRLDVNDRAFTGGLEGMQKRAREMSALFRRIAPLLKADQAEHARREEGPGGGWQPRASPKNERKVNVFREVKKRKGGLTARYFTVDGLLGALPEILQVRAVGFSAYAKSPIRWAGAHQHGATVGRGAKIPARPFVWVSPELQAKAVEMIQKWLADGVRKGGGKRRRGRPRKR